MNEAKPFCISKKEVWEAYERVKENKGAAGVDGQSIEDFEKRLKKNLYKIWNRMSSGSYFPPPVRTVKIPKKNGGERKLGIPTVADRIAQQVVKARLEPEVEPLFHADSYGYRPGKSALDAVGQARERCWRSDWVLDLDIKGFFDNLSQDLLLRAVKKHAPEQWIVLYIERWLKAPVQEEDGRLVPRERGTPQGGVISPLLANLFLHYALDRWLATHYPQVPFERYADDVIAHCRTEKLVSMSAPGHRHLGHAAGWRRHPGAEPDRAADRPGASRAGRADRPDAHPGQRAQHPAGAQIPERRQRDAVRAGDPQGDRLLHLLAGPFADADRDQEAPAPRAGIGHCDALPQRNPHVVTALGAWLEFVAQPAHGDDVPRVPGGIDRLHLPDVQSRADADRAGERRDGPGPASGVGLEIGASAQLTRSPMSG